MGRTTKNKKNKDGRHVGLDFYDLLIEGDYTQNPSQPLWERRRRMGSKSSQLSRPTIEYSITFAAIAIAYTTTITTRSGGPSSAIKMNELGQSMSSSSPNEWSKKYQRSKRTTGTTKPASPHQQTQFLAVSFILSDITRISG